METIVALIATRSALLQQGLSALLRSIPGVTLVKTVQDLPGAFEWIEQQRPRLVLLDEDLFRGDALADLDRMRELSVSTQRVIMVIDVHRADFFLAHAEAILIKGMLPSAIANIVSDLLSVKGDKNGSEK